MMTLDRYLRRVGFWLPRRERADILDELRGAIDERLDAAEQRTGRPLHEQELEEVLHSFGDPVLVVARYVRRAPVISGGLAFFFWRVLAIALGGTIVVQLALLAVEAAQAPSIAAALLNGMTRMAVALLLGFACVTAAFVILDRRYGLQSPRSSD
ncbi:HAAS signaling domain-containing protein [Sphingomonas sp. PB4P5]|uniref:HAAS signaling domain-containing protein n=1 Tax=Parasphingomonas puruogangriensis TaxID=3096155 RepID=UPI002FC95A93